MKSVQREIAGLDRIEKVSAVTFAVLRDERFGFGIGEIGDPLLGAKMEFDPDAPVRRVDHREGVAAEEVHMAEALRDAAVRHHDRDLVQRLGQRCPEIPVTVGTAQPGARIAFDRVVEIGKAQRVPGEEHRRVVADDIPVALL